MVDVTVVGGELDSVGVDVAVGVGVEDGGVGGIETVPVEVPLTAAPSVMPSPEPSAVSETEWPLMMPELERLRVAWTEKEPVVVLAPEARRLTVLVPRSV